jgi:hypothetical protein
MDMAETTNENSGMLTESIDRRSALKKAAAAGAIAWTAPMIISSTAHADHLAGNGVCTPACAPLPFTISFSGKDGGDGKFGCPDDRTKFGVPNNSNKFGVFKVETPGTATCPCGIGDPVIIVSFPAGTTWSKDEDECQPWADDYALTYLTTPPSNEFAVAKDGAIGNGWYTPSNPICVSVGCHDEVGGDMVYQTCTFSFTFYYDPNGASCSTYGAELLTCGVTRISCSVGCTPCV